MAGWILTDLGPKQWRDPRIATTVVVVLGLLVFGGAIAMAGAA